MKKIIAFGASSSKESINKTFAEYIGNMVGDVELELLDLNDYEMPIYSIDREKESGIHPLAQKFKSKIEGADGIIISFAEHNGSFSAAFKNIYDWVSRIDANVWQGKPLLITATSPGGMGGRRVLEHAEYIFGHRNENLITGIGLPNFNDNFSKEEGIKDLNISIQFERLLVKFRDLL